VSNITVTMPAELAQQIINLLGEMPAKASAKVLLEFLALAQDAAKPKPED
jgi:hypothetical protein